MRRLRLVLGMFLVVCEVSVGEVQAQPNPLQGPQTITVVDAGACATAGACASFSMNNFTVGTLEVSGTFTGTLTPEMLVNSVWVPVTLYDGTGTPFTTVTAPGAFSVANTGFARVRLRAGAFASGTATVYLRQGYFMAKLPGGGARILAPNGTTSAPSYSFTNFPTVGFYAPSAGNLDFVNGGANQILYTSNLMRMGSGGVVGWGNLADPNTSSTDTGISRTAASTVTIGNGTQGDGTGTLTAANITLIGTMQSVAAILGSTGSLDFGSRGYLAASADANFTLRNQALTVGSTLKVDALPTISSGFGTSPSITAGSTPLAGSVNVGTGGTATSGVILFNGTAFPSTPFCVLTANGGSTVIVGNPNTTQMTIASTPAFPASTIVSWHCISSK